MHLLLVCCAPASIALLVILAIQLKDICPQSGGTVPQIARDIAFIVLIVFVLNLAFGHHLDFIGKYIAGGAR